MAEGKTGVAPGSAIALPGAGVEGRKLMHNWPECKPFYGVPIPNRYECASAPPVVTNCASICHNHGSSCPAGGSKCGTVEQSIECAETCSWQSCGTDGKVKAAGFMQGPANIGCPDHCKQAPKTTCSDLKMAYKSEKCCGEDPHKAAHLPPHMCPAFTPTTCRQIKKAFQESKCCGEPGDKGAMVGESCALMTTSDCPLECLGDYSQHHDEEEGDPGCADPACMGPSPPSHCSFIPGCGGGGSDPTRPISSPGPEASPTPVVFGR
jgi:hypothetical protein